MSFSSKPKKIKPKASVKELKLVQSVSRCGVDVLKAEEITKTNIIQPKTPSTSQPNPISYSKKRQKLDFIDVEPIPFDLDDLYMLDKPKTLVFIFLILIECHLKC